jgi:hypothetical protein
MEIAAMIGQKILFSRRASNMFLPGGTRKSNKGATIKEKAHAKVGIIANLSSIGATKFGRRRFAETP